MTLRGDALMSSRTAECGLVPVSLTTVAATTANASVAEVTKKSITLPLHVGPEGAWITPFSSSSHPVPRISSGVMLKSPARIHGPRSSPMTPAIAWRRSTFRCDRPSPKKRYTLMRCTPPRHRAPSHRTMILDASTSKGGVCGERAKPKCERAATATPALVLPATVSIAGPTVKDQPP